MQTRARLNFTEANKDYIVERLTSKAMTPTQLANTFMCHPKSITRVLEERGLAATRSKAKEISDATRLKKLLKETGFTMSDIETMARKKANMDALFKAPAGVMHVPV